MSTKKKRITISLPDHIYEKMISIIDKVNSNHLSTKWIDSKSVYVGTLILEDNADRWD